MRTPVVLLSLLVAIALSPDLHAGGTGNTTCGAGDFVQGNGASPLSCTSVGQYEVITSGGSGTVHGVGPGTTNLPLIGQGASAYPTFGGLQVAGGGTGANTLASGNLIVGNGIGTVNTLAPGTSGNVATSNGSTWVSQGPGLTAFAENTGFAVTVSYSSITSISSTSITVPAAGYLMIQENFMANNSGTGPFTNVEFGIGVDTATAFAREEIVGTTAGTNTAMSVSYKASVAAGTHTVYALGIVSSGSGPTILADADISVWWSAN